jgi:hypothetical protein
LWGEERVKILLLACRYQEVPSKDTEDIPLFFTLIPILALLSNYDQEICLIHVGTERLHNTPPTLDLS